MSQHASEACNESDGLWLPITEYSVKSGVSLSTIRRKIKSKNIQCRLEKGKYFILFSEMNKSDTKQLPLPRYADSGRRTEETFIRKPLPLPEIFDRESEETEGEKAVRMLSDAFEHALKEKDERIRLLEQRNFDLEERLEELRLLVRVLEEKYEVRY